MKSKKDVKKWTDDEDFDFLLTNNIITTKENESAYKKMLYIKKKMQISDPTIRGYTIAPTLDCNFNCEYCFEESRPPIYMDEKTEKAIIEMIKNDSRIRILHIDWYEGEPLMGFDIIERISKEILTIKNIQYSASIITNGYLLTEEKIKKLKELRVTDVQVTIDGDRETHNKKRPHIKGFGTYDIIIENLKKFYNVYPNGEITVAIRVNIDNKNKDKYFNTFSTLKTIFPNAIIYPGIIDNISGSVCNSAESCSLNQDSLVTFLIEENQKHKGFLVMPSYPSNLLENTCIAESYYNYLIDSKGNLYKCWNDIGKKEKIVGNLHDGKKFNAIVLSNYLYDADVFNDKYCTSCKHLYICGGGCPAKRLTEIDKPKKRSCHIFKNHLSELLQLYYENI